jgi:adenosylcobinamide-phosphate synthase
MAAARIRRRARATAIGLAADLAIGEPRIDPHPVAAFGTTMARIEHLIYEDSTQRGLLHTAAGVVIGLAAGRATRSTAAATYLAVAPNALIAAAKEVHAALAADDLAQARRDVVALVGRDPTDLDAKELARATIESLAENTVDAIVAPALAALVAGAPGALAYRAINTMDADIGHRSPRYAHYGWSAARLDDVANYVPARVTAALVAAARPRRARAIARTVRRDARHHPSPNAGVAEAAYAAALGLRLGGTNTYDGTGVERRPDLGDGRPPEPHDIAAAIILTTDITLLLTGLLAAWGITR